MEKKPPPPTIVKQTKTLAMSLDQIEVDWTVNARHQGKPIDTSDPRFIQLRENIRITGLLENLVVTPIRKDGKTIYLLTAGFRRYAAIKSLGFKSCYVNVREAKDAGEKKSRKEILITNGQENLVREDLTHFDLAARCAQFKTEFGMTAKEISVEWGIHENTIGTYIRVFTKLHPKILNAWKKHDESYYDLIRLAPLEHEEQLEKWNELNEIRKERAEGSGGPEESTEPSHGKEKEQKLVPMRRRIDLEAAIQYTIPNAEEICIPEGWLTFTDDEKKVAKAILRWVINGKKKSIFRGPDEGAEEDEAPPRKRKS